MRFWILVVLLIVLVCVSCTTTQNAVSSEEVKNQVPISQEVREEKIEVDDEVLPQIVEDENKTLEPIIETINPAASPSIKTIETRIWQPRPGLRWHWQLSGEINEEYDVDVYDIDLFESDAALISRLQQRGVGVICYFSAGSVEDWREDASLLPARVIGKELEGWEGENWVDIRSSEVKKWVTQRLDLAVAKGCDAVEPDNVDGFEQETGFALRHQDQLDFNEWMAREAHARGLAIGLKNDLMQIEELVDDFDFAVNEECFEQENCEDILPFVESGKAVFGAEYALEKRDFCSKALAMDFSWIRAEYDLDGATSVCSS
ncbi:endo alpha-1,4 polygalactosaminidase [Candidatus Woesearchaeota archaeon]|nr:endo alpha-1,4 polygalactosaminidase [Candidatus Woesearchaeota archaeon]